MNLRKCQVTSAWIIVVFLHRVRTREERNSEIGSIIIGPLSGNDENNENWHSETLSPSVPPDYEPKIVTASDFYLKEISKQLSAINKKIDRAMIRMVGSTVKGEDNDGRMIGKSGYRNFTLPNCETLMQTDYPSGIYHFSDDNATIINFHWIWNVFNVYCDQSFGGGWTVIQRRGDFHSRKNYSRINFGRKSWDDYAKGFGHLDDDFWLGNQWIHRMTSLFGPYELRVEFEELQGRKFWTEYSQFDIASSKDNYRLTVVGESLGNYTDASKSQNFRSDEACTMNFSGIWWYPDNCIGANLNSDYYKSTKMMIRSKKKFLHSNIRV